MSKGRFHLEQWALLRSSVATSFIDVRKAVVSAWATYGRCPSHAQAHRQVPVSKQKSVIWHCHNEVEQSSWAKERVIQCFLWQKSKLRSVYCRGLPLVLGGPAVIR